MNEIKKKDTRVVSYTSMANGTREDYLLGREIAKPFRAETADRVLKYMEELHEGFPGEQVDRYEHCLQTATRAYRDGADEETVVAGVLHDIGDRLAPDNHAELAATMMKPYVTPACHWMVLHHAIFQGYFFWHHFDRDRYVRERFKNHFCYEKTKEFTDKWDSEAFDPKYDTLPIGFFEPMIRRIFAREPWGPQTKVDIDKIPTTAITADITTAGAFVKK